MQFKIEISVSKLLSLRAASIVAEKLRGYTLKVLARVHCRHFVSDSLMTFVLNSSNRFHLSCLYVQRFSVLDSQMASLSRNLGRTVEDQEFLSNMPSWDYCDDVWLCYGCYDDRQLLAMAVNGDSWVLINTNGAREIQASLRARVDGKR